MGSPRITSALAGTAVALLAAIGVSAPASAALEDLTPETLIGVVEIDPGVVTTTTGTPEPSTVDYRIMLNVSCGDFQFEQNCDSFTFRGQYVYFVHEDPATNAGTVISDYFTFNTSGAGLGSIEVPSELAGGDWYVMFDLEIASSEVGGLDGRYTNHPLISGGESTPVYGLPAGVDDRFVVLAGCSGTCGGNAPPGAANDSYATAFDTPLSVGAGAGVLANDTDDNLATLTATLETPASHGVVLLNPDGSFDYTPDPGFSGEDSFTYTASDGELDSTPATVTITVDPWEDLVGPAVTRLHVKPGRLTLGRDATVTAVVDDTGLGGSAVLGVEINVDGAGWEPMPPKRGTFDSVKVTAQAVVSLDTAGQLEICVRGIDAAGNTGPELCARDTVE